MTCSLSWLDSFLTGGSFAEDIRPRRPYNRPWALIVMLVPACLIPVMAAIYAWSGSLRTAQKTPKVKSK